MIGRAYGHYSRIVSKSSRTAWTLQRRILPPYLPPEHRPEILALVATDAE
jgi:hypothetical protein